MERGEGGRYLYAVFPPEEAGPLTSFLPGRATDDVEFLIPDDNDTRVEIRSASRLPDVSDGGRQARRLGEIRARLGWEEVGWEPSYAMCGAISFHSLLVYVCSSCYLV